MEALNTVVVDNNKTMQIQSSLR